jgi:SET domain
MTTVRPTNETDKGLGLFAARDYSVGEEIIVQNEPLVELTPQNEDQVRVISESLVVPGNDDPHNDEGKNVETHKTTAALSLFSSILVPESVDTRYHGAFRGMVQAGLCFGHRVILDANAVPEALFTLYHPSLETDKTRDTFKSGSAKGSDTTSEAEARIVHVAFQACDYLNVRLDQSSPIYKVLFADNSTKSRLLQVMLIWSCNAFEGGRIYDEISRVNHSCNPNAVIITDNENKSIQRLVSARAIPAGTEITISYLGIFLYASTSVRKVMLETTKHFVCQCEQCTSGIDKSSCMPCMNCHKRVAGAKSLEEDVQYDDEHDVSYMVQEAGSNTVWKCSSCNVNIDRNDERYQSTFVVCDKVINKVTTFLQDYHVFGKTSVKPISSLEDSQEDLAEEVEQVRLELLEDLLRMSSSVLGALHWTTNLLLLLQLDDSLESLHGSLLSQEASDKQDNMTSLAESIDMLERLMRFVGQHHVGLHCGHLLSNLVISTARALVSLGDVKSQKYAADWLGKIQDYVDRFEPEMTKKIVHALSTAWTRNRNNPTAEPNKKRAKTS